MGSHLEETSLATAPNLCLWLGLCRAPAFVKPLREKLQYARQLKKIRENKEKKITYQYKPPYIYYVGALQLAYIKIDSKNVKKNKC